MKCPKCHSEMVKVKLYLYKGQLYPDGLKGYKCNTCGYIRKR